MTVLRVGYKSGVRFDHDYYMTKHLPLTGAVMGPYGVKSVEVMRVTAAPDGSAATYQVIFSAYFESAAALQNALNGPRMGEVLADIPKYYDAAPDIWIGEVVPLPQTA
jgi:uncharacterized protein (TIGR02118 family)